MALDTYALLADLTDLKAYLEIPAGTSTYDSLLERMVNSFSVYVEEVATSGRRFKQRSSQVEYYDGDGSNVLQLDNYPVISVASVHDDYDHDWGADTLIAADEYTVRTAAGIIILWEGEVFTTGTQNIKVTYDYGWATVPKAVADVCIEAVAIKFRAWQEKDLTRTSEKAADGSITFTSKDLLPLHREVLEGYRKRTLDAV